MTITFLTFANTSYTSLDRIKSQAEDFGLFDEIKALTEHDISHIIDMHKELINLYSKGFGLWIWKPEIIVETLEKMNDGDILLYLDAGCHLNKNGKKRFEYYLEKLDEHDLVTFSAGNYDAKEFVKMDAIQKYYPEFKNNVNQLCYAGILLIKKTDRTMHLMIDWLNLCRNYELLDPFESIYNKEAPYYKGNDCDSGLLNICLAKHKIHYIIDANETNCHDELGQQIHSKDLNWDLLNDFPIQCRRSTPRQDDLIRKYY